MRKAKKNKRRWYQFSLRWLFLITTLLIAALAGWRWYTEPFRQQQRVIDIVERLGGTCVTRPGGPAWLLQYLNLGDYRLITTINLSNCNNLTTTDLRRIGKLSDLESLILDRSSVSDRDLEQITNLAQLRTLSLEYTDISDRGRHRSPPCLCANFASHTKRKQTRG